jgi:hypothetical protein
LGLTRETGKFPLEDLSTLTKMPLSRVRELAEELSIEGILTLEQGVASVDAEKRVRMALKSLAQGADPEKVCRLLSWQEFEEISVNALEANGFSAVKHFVLKAENHRREIDVIGVGRMLVICLDCKHWTKGVRGAVGEGVASRQIERVQSLAADERSKSRLGISSKATVYFVPAIVSLLDSGQKFILEVPIVPVLKLNSFLSSIDPFIEGLFTLKVKGRVQ